MAGGVHPKIDPRDASKVFAELRTSIAQHCGVALDVDDASAGRARALAGVVAHLAGIVIDRINRTPDKAFLTFLDLIGATPQPPQPARVPLTFSLTQGAPGDARVPKGTQVAASPAPGEDAPPVFSTSSEIFLTGAELVFACMYDAISDSWRDVSSTIGLGAPVRGLPIFTGEPIARRLWIAHDLLDVGGIEQLMVTAGGDLLSASPGIAWSLWRDQRCEPAGSGAGAGRWSISDLPPLPAAEARARNGAIGPRGSWLVADLGRARTGRGAGSDVAFTFARAANGLPPDAAFSGSTPVDTTKTFWPFGTHPVAGDAFYVSCEAAFAPAGPGDDQTITLAFVPDAVLPAEDASRVSAGLTWEYWNGSRWAPIGSTGSGTGDGGADATATFRGDGFPLPMFVAGASDDGARPLQLAFKRPLDWRPGTVGSTAGHWLRAWISSGDYGRDAYYVPSASGVGGYTVVPATWNPPRFRSLACGYRYRSPSVAPSRVLLELPHGFEDISATARGAPDIVSGELLPADGPAIYLAFQRSGADRVFGDRPVSLYVSFEATDSTEIDETSPLGAGRPAVLNWEYRAAAGGWQPLDVRDETAGLTTSGLVGFLAPADLAPSRLFGREAAWLRACLVAPGDAPATPRLDRITTNTVWAERSTRIDGEVLGSGTGDPGQAFQTGQTPILSGQIVEVREPERPSGTSLDLIRSEEGVDCVDASTLDADGTPQVWVRWHEVPDFFGSVADSRHYTIDRLGGQIRCGDGRQGRMVPRGTGNVRISYTTGGGSAGNRPAGAVRDLQTALPYVAAVVNLAPASGGSDAEADEAVALRGPRMLRHRGRAVTASDFEDLAVEASPAIARVRCIPAEAGGAPSCVTLIVVPTSDLAQPAPSVELLRRVQARVSSAASPAVRLAVRGPTWIEVSVTAEVVPTSLEQAATVRETVLAALGRYLHPLNGGTDGRGWPFGRGPHRSELFALIQGQAGVDHVRALAIQATPGNGVADSSALVFPGTHTITMVGGNRQP